MEGLKMKKRILAILLACLMVLPMLAGCNTGDGNGNNNTPATGDNSPTQGGNSSSPATGGSGNSSNSNDKVSKVIVAFCTWSGPPADLKKIQDALNAISVPAIGVEAELLVLDFASYNQQMNLMMSGNEQLDVLITLGGLYMPGVQNGQYTNLEENDLLKTYGQGIIDAMGMDIINACRVGGVLYGLPNNRDMAVGKGCFAFRTDILQAVGYQFQNKGEIETGTMATINDLFTKIHAQYPDIEVYRPVTNALMQNANVDYLGGSVYGVLMDSGNNLNVVSFFDTDFYMNYCKQVYAWNQAGYMSPDVATDTTAVGDLVKAGVLAAYNTGGKPGIKAQEGNLCGYDMTIIQTGIDFMSSSAVAGFPWAIPINTADPVAAMKWLNLLYSDAGMMNTICWGIEGQHYVQGSDGLLTFPSGVDASTSGYNHAMNWMFPNQYLLKVWTGDDPNLWTNMRAFNNNSVKSKALGFAFDSSSVATEVTSVTNVYSEYQKSLEFGLVDPATGIPDLVSAMKAAGLDKVIAEKQAQLNAWAAVNGIS